MCDVVIALTRKVPHLERDVGETFLVLEENVAAMISFKGKEILKVSCYMFISTVVSLL